MKQAHVQLVEQNKSPKKLQPALKKRELVTQIQHRNINTNWSLKKNGASQMIDSTAEQDDIL